MNEVDLRREMRRALLVTRIIGFLLMAFGVGLFFLGYSFEEPGERISTRSVPAFAPLVLSISGVLVALTGLVMMIRGVRAP